MLSQQEQADVEVRKLSDVPVNGIFRLLNDPDHILFKAHPLLAISETGKKCNLDGDTKVEFCPTASLLTTTFSKVETDRLFHKSKQSGRIAYPDLHIMFRNRGGGIADGVANYYERETGLPGTLQVWIGRLG